MNTPHDGRRSVLVPLRAAVLGLAALAAGSFAGAQTPGRVLSGSALDMRWVLYGPGLLDDVVSLNPFVVRLSAPPSATFLGARYDPQGDAHVGVAILAYRLRADLEDAYRYHQRQLRRQGFIELATAPGERAWAGSFQRANDILQLQVSRGEDFVYRAQLDFLGVRPGVAPGQALTPANPMNPIDPRESVLLTNTPIIETRRGSVRFRLPSEQAEATRGEAYVLRLPPSAVRVRSPLVSDQGITWYFEARPGPEEILTNFGEQLVRQGFTRVAATEVIPGVVSATYTQAGRRVRVTVETADEGVIAQPYEVRVDLQPADR